MFRLVIRFIGKFLIVVMASILMVACNNDTKKATSTAKAFLQAYYVDLDFETALRFCSDDSRDAINEQAKIKALNPYAKEEIPNILFQTIEMEPNAATCIYTCNRVERKLPLRKLNGKWLVSLQGGTVETSSVGTDFVELSSSANDGFASATSGSIKYKKRRQGNPTN